MGNSGTDWLLFFNPPPKKVCDVSCLGQNRGPNPLSPVVSFFPPVRSSALFIQTGRSKLGKQCLFLYHTLLPKFKQTAEWTKNSQRNTKSTSWAVLKTQQPKKTLSLNVRILNKIQFRSPGSSSVRSPFPSSLCLSSDYPPLAARVMCVCASGLNLRGCIHSSAGWREERGGQKRRRSDASTSRQKRRRRRASEGCGAEEGGVGWGGGGVWGIWVTIKQPMEELSLFSFLL